MTGATLRAGRIAFTALLLIGVIVVIGNSFLIGSTARTFPLIVAVPAAMLLVLQLWHDIRPGIADRIRFLQEQAIVEVELPDDLGDTAGRQSSDGAEAEGVSEGRVFAWLGGLTAAMYFAHYLIAAPVFMLAFLRLQARAGWKVSLIVTAVVWAVLYLLFYRLLRIDFF